MYFFPAETVAAVAEAGMKANISRCVQCFDENQTVGQNTQIPQSVELFEKYHNAENGRIRIDFSVHAEYTCKPHIVRAYSELCKAHGGRMHIHLSETQREVDECIARYRQVPRRVVRGAGDAGQSHRRGALRRRERRGYCHSEAPRRECYP